MLKHLSMSMLFFTFFSSIVLISIQSTTFAASCTADCGGGNSVTCTGPQCTAVDGDGCTGNNEKSEMITRSKCFH